MEANATQIYYIIRMENGKARAEKIITHISHGDRYGGERPVFDQIIMSHGAIEYPRISIH